MHLILSVTLNGYPEGSDYLRTSSPFEGNTAHLRSTMGKFFLLKTFPSTESSSSSMTITFYQRDIKQDVTVHIQPRRLQSAGVMGTEYNTGYNTARFSRKRKEKNCVLVQHSTVMLLKDHSIRTSRVLSVGAVKPKKSQQNCCSEVQSGSSLFNTCTNTWKNSPELAISSIPAEVREREEADLLRRPMLLAR